MDVTIDGSFLIMHHEGRIKLCNTMVWFSNEDKLLNCLLLKKKQTKKTTTTLWPRRKSE